MTSLALAEIRTRAAAFANEWREEKSERAEAQTFWNEFFEVFGVNRRRTGVRFEKASQRFGKKAKGRIDVFWPGLLLRYVCSRPKSDFAIPHKSFTTTSRGPTAHPHPSSLPLMRERERPRNQHARWHWFKKSRPQRKPFLMPVPHIPTPHWRNCMTQ